MFKWKFFLRAFQDSSVRGQGTDRFGRGFHGAGARPAEETGQKSGPAAAWAGPSCAVRVLGLGGGVRAIHVEKTRKTLCPAGFHWSG